MELLTSASQNHTLRAAEDCGALGEVETALRRAYELTISSPKGRLNPSATVVGELRNEDWCSGRVWAPDQVLGTNDQFDGWKAFTDSAGSRFGVAVEVEWSWGRVFIDFLKFWRGVQGNQISFGIEVLRGPSAFKYAVEHSYPLYAELIKDVPIIFCALDAEDLREPEYEGSPPQYKEYPMPGSA